MNEKSRNYYVPQSEAEIKRLESILKESGYRILSGREGTTPSSIFSSKNDSYVGEIGAVSLEAYMWSDEGRRLASIVANFQEEPVPRTQAAG